VFHYPYILDNPAHITSDSPVGRAASVKTVERVEHGALPFRRTAKSCAAVRV